MTLPAALQRTPIVTKGILRHGAMHSFHITFLLASGTTRRTLLARGRQNTGKNFALMKLTLFERAFFQ